MKTIFDQAQYNLWSVPSQCQDHIRDDWNCSHLPRGITGYQFSGNSNATTRWKWHRLPLASDTIFSVTWLVYRPYRKRDRSSNFLTVVTYGTRFKNRTDRKMITCEGTQCDLPIDCASEASRRNVAKCCGTKLQRSKTTHVDNFVRYRT